MFRIGQHLFRIKTAFISIISVTILGGCASIPTDIAAVSELDLDAYQGTWYEIARMDSRFETDLINVTASYTPMDDGNIEVKNRGFDTVKNQWDDIVGKAKIASDETNAMLKVSFFGPFYSGYNVIALADDYSYAMVCGSSRDYLWILARHPKFSTNKTMELIAKAKELGFETDKLVMVPQEGDVE